ncbi:MAG: hypothetical protein J0H32_14345, partial [Rhizobiales bacterium]|nr:hypothetical protein [Hyphomicrobiales bacterium]
RGSSQNRKCVAAYAWPMLTQCVTMEPGLFARKMGDKADHFSEPARQVLSLAQLQSPLTPRQVVPMVRRLDRGTCGMGRGAVALSARLVHLIDRV